MFDDAIVFSDGNSRHLDDEIFPAYYPFGNFPKKKSTLRHKKLNSPEIKRNHDDQVLDSTLNTRELDALRRGLGSEFSYSQMLNNYAKELTEATERTMHDSAHNLPESLIDTHVADASSEKVFVDSEGGVSTIMALSIMFIFFTLMAIFLRAQGANPVTYVLPLGLAGMFLIVGMILEGNIFRARAHQ